jgi:FtsX-like permease family
MGLFAVWLAVRSTVARSWVATASVAVLLGVVGGIVSSALWGAERAETSYQRLVNEVDAPDVLIFCDGQCDDRQSKVEQMRAEPSVAEATVMSAQFPSIRTQSGAFLGAEPTVECSTGAGELGLIWSRWHDGQPAARIVAGRLPEVGSTDEVVLPAITAERAGIEVGDTVVLTAECGVDDLGQLETPIELKVVGIAVGFLDVRPPGQTEHLELLLADNALLDRTGFGNQTMLATWLRPGANAADLSPSVTEAGVFFDMTDRSAQVKESLAPDASALRLFALGASLAALAVLGQLVWASVRLAVVDHRKLTLLGARRSQIVKLGLIHGAVIGLGAGLVAAVTTVGFARWVPLGSAAAIDQGSDVGFAVGVGLLAGIGTLLAAVVLAAAPSAVATRSDVRIPKPRARRLPSRLVETLNVPPTPSLGARFALEPAVGPRPVPIRSGLLAIVISLTFVTGVMTFASGLNHLRTTPRLVGWNWDFFVGLDDRDIEALADEIAERPDVERSGMGIIFSPGLSLDDDFSDELEVIGFDARAGGVSPSVIKGRSPEGPDEILLAPGLADRYHLSVGDVTTLYGFTPLAQAALALDVSSRALGDEEVTGLPIEVVGIGVIPTLDGRLDRGAALTLDGFERSFPVPARSSLRALFDQADPENVLRLLFDEGGPVGLTETELREFTDAGPDGVSEVLAGWSDEQFDRLVPSDASRPQLVFVDLEAGQSLSTVLQRFIDDGLADEQFVSEWFGSGSDGRDSGQLSSEELVKLDLSDVAWIPTSFGYLMMLTALAALSYVVATGAGARRNDLATMRALGLRPGQVRAAIAWQSVVTVAVGLAIALPIGIVAGRTIWYRYATGLEVVPEPVTPWGQLAAFAAATVVVALFVSLAPGWAAARKSTVEVLRSE